MALLILVAAIGLPRAGFGLDPVDLASLRDHRDMTAALAAFDAAQRIVEVQVPGAASAPPRAVRLSAQGPGPRYNWVVAALSNSSDAPRQAVLSIPHQGFAGSGFMPPRLAGPRLYSSTVVGAGQIEFLPMPGETAYLVSLPAGGAASIVFETTHAGLPSVTLWQREAYDARKDYLSFFRGALLGVSVLLAIALFALYGFRSRAVFPVAGGFAVAAIAFMMLEAGHLPALMNRLRLPGLDLQVMRAAVEGAMAAFLLLLLAVLSEVERLSRTAGMLLLTLGVLAFGLPIYGFADPLLAASLARGLFAATAVLGFVLITVLWRMGEVKAETALLSWGAILVWTFLAITTALAVNPEPAMSGLLMAGLGGVLVVLGFVMAHHAFSQGFLSRRFFREAGRHALALAGARAYVWDWQPEEGELHVSPELGRALAQPADVFDGTGGEGLLEIMHPADRSAYLATIEAAARDGRMPIERMFRLEHGEGGYRWFELRARSITGHGLRAVRCIGTMADVTDARLAEERLLQDAVHDVVTGLPNRALFVDRLERAMQAWDAAEPGGLFVLLVDLDRFRMVNEALGHEAGDGLLSIVGRRLKSETGLADTVARLPGDKFAILFHETPGRRDVASVADLLVKAVARPVQIGDHEVLLNASVGIVQYRGEEIPAEALLRNAAIALYEARRTGGEAVELFHPGMAGAQAELVVLEAELRRALERNEIEVHYQPVARLADMHLAGFEALVRWRHPTLGLLAPESFLGLAEDAGLIREIGRVLLNEAGRQLGIWQRAYRGSEPAFVAVRLSSSQLIEPELLDDVKQLINRENLRRGSLKIEVTESVLMQYPERAARILERFRDLGVGLSCGGFGSGYSSLSSLRTVPFDMLKVGRSFLGQDGHEQRDLAILKAIVAMARDLGLTVVAEGIENQEQVDGLGALGCDYGQGPFIGKPMSAKQVNDALAGLPYAYSSGRTAVTWLWERGIKDPPPEPNLRPLTGRDLEKPDGRPAPHPRLAPEQPVKFRFDTPAMPPPPAPEPEPELEPELDPAHEPEQQEPVHALEPQPAEEDAQKAAMPPADTPDADEPPPPLPRRRKRQRRVPLLDDQA